MEKIALKIGPPPSPNRDKFPFVGTVHVQGLTIDLENLAGSVREGKSWKTKMKYHYGEIRKTLGVDRDKLDVYIGPNPQSKKVFIVHQNFVGKHRKAGKYDEDKVMLGFNSAEEAKRGYLKQYSRKDFFRSITEMPMAQFKKSIFKENKGEKVASIEPWSNEERALLSAASPEDVGHSFYTGAGAYQATGGRDDQDEYDRQRMAREHTYNADPELREKWTRFMENNPGFRPPVPQKTAASCSKPDKDTLSNKLRRFSKNRKKDKNPSTFIREKMKIGSLKEAYTLGWKTALAALMPTAPTVENSTPMAKAPKSVGLTLPSPPKGAPPAASSGASSGATETS
jgi:hypothetical protein